MKQRRYEIDWLRVIDMLTVFVFHCTRFMIPLPFCPTPGQVIFGSSRRSSSYRWRLCRCCAFSARSGASGSSTGWLAGWAARPDVVFLFLIPLAAVRIALRWMSNEASQNWAEFLWYAQFYVIGYIIPADSRFTEGVKRVGWLCLPLWIGTFVIIIGLAFLIQYDPTLGRGFSLFYLVHVIGWSIITWSAVVFMLSLGAKYLAFNNKLLTYSNETLLPFYLLHQTIILIVGWFVLPWNIPNLARFLTIALFSFPVIMVICETFVRRVGFMRFLFGMSLKKLSTVTRG